MPIDRRSFLKMSAGMAAASVLPLMKCAPKKRENPNIVFIFADDLGYGDLSCQNPNSKIQTPNLDKLASQGVRFTDAHTSSAVCSPSRYSVLTGRYNWRSQLKSGVLNGYSSHLIESGRKTVASLLKQHGYRTGGVGKWHLGWDWAQKSGDYNRELIPPDRHKELYHKIWAEEKFKEITQAYHILSDPEKRAFYKMVYYTGFYDDIINEYTIKESKPDSYYEKDWPDSSHEFDYESWLMLLYIPMVLVLVLLGVSTVNAILFPYGFCIVSSWVFYILNRFKIF